MTATNPVYTAMYPSRPKRFSVSKFLYWTCVILIGIISPAVLGLIAHVLVKVHDVENIHRTSSYVVLFSATVGSLDGFIFTVLGLMGKDFHWRANITGKKYESFRLRIPAIGATIAFGAILRSIAVTSYAQYDYYDAQGKIANWTNQHLGEDTQYRTPELLLCHNGTASATACLEGQGARWLTVPLALLSCMTFCLILWIWRRGNMEAAGFIRTRDSHMSRPSETTLEEGQSTPMSLKDDGPDANEARRPVELHYQHVNELEETEIHEMDGAACSTGPKPNDDEAAAIEPRPRFSWEDAAKTPATAAPETHSRFSWEGTAKSPTTLSPLSDAHQSQSKRGAAHRDDGSNTRKNNNKNRRTDGTDTSYGSSWPQDDSDDVPEWWRD